MSRRISRIRGRMDAFAERMAAVQAKLFLNVFYILVVPVGHAYLRVTRGLYHETTGFFQDAEHKTNELEQHFKQY